NHIATQIDVIQSDRVALRALRALHLQESDEWRARWKAKTDGRGSFEAWVAERLLKKLDVHPSRDSNVIGLSYTSTDPEFAANVANAFMQAYIDTSLELRLEPARQYNNFFDERAKRLR